MFLEKEKTTLSLLNCVFQLQQNDKFQLFTPVRRCIPTAIWQTFHTNFANTARVFFISG